MLDKATIAAIKTAWEERRVPHYVGALFDHITWLDEQLRNAQAQQEKMVAQEREIIALRAEIDNLHAVVRQFRECDRLAALANGALGKAKDALP